MNEIGDWFKALVNFHGNVEFITPLASILVVLGIAIHFIPDKIRDAFFRAWQLMPVFVKIILLAVFFSSLNIFGMSAVAPFIYFQF